MVNYLTWFEEWRVMRKTVVNQKESPLASNNCVQKWQHSSYPSK